MMLHGATKVIGRKSENRAMDASPWPVYVIRSRHGCRLGLGRVDRLGHGRPLTNGYFLVADARSEVR